MSEIKTINDLIEAYKNGQRFFEELEFEKDCDFSDLDFSNVIFKNCWFMAIFHRTDLHNTKFIGCNLKCSDFKWANLTNSQMKECMIEATEFKWAKTKGFVFESNYYYGLTLEQKDFERVLLDKPY